MKLLLLVLLALAGGGLKSVKARGQISLAEYEAYLDDIELYMDQLDKEIDMLANQTEDAFD
jgi:hypothetical protein